MFSGGIEKQKGCLGLGDIKTVITFLLYIFFNSKLGRMLFNSYNNRSCDFYVFPVFGIGAVNFQIKKTAKPPLFQGVISHQKKWKNPVMLFFVSYTM